MLITNNKQNFKKIKIMQKFTNLFMFRLSFQKIIKKIMKNKERI